MSRAFFRRPTLQVAPELLGKYLVDARSREKRRARIVEVEAYIGEADPACHAACGPTRRNQIMYGVPGFAYIYFIYGMYHCLNVVTEPKGHPSAVLIRAAEPGDGFDAPIANPGKSARMSHLLSGPGKLCRTFGLTLRENGLDLTVGDLYLEDRGDVVTHVRCSTRIGVRKGAENLWRFFDGVSAAVSVQRMPSRAYDGDAVKQEVRTAVGERVRS